MDKLTQKKANRLRFLNELYRRTDGDTMEVVDMWELGGELEFTEDETQRVTDYLAGEQLLEYRLVGGGIAITHFGVVQVETALSTPDEPTQYFPPVVNVLNVQNMVGSSVQQSGHRSTQTAKVTTQERTDWREFVAAMRNDLPNLGLSTAAKSEAEADLDTVDAQANSPKPKLSVVRECFVSLRTILEEVTGNVVAAELLNRLSHML